MKRFIYQVNYVYFSLVLATETERRKSTRFNICQFLFVSIAINILKMTTQKEERNYMNFPEAALLMPEFPIKCKTDDDDFPEIN